MKSWNALNFENNFWETEQNRKKICLTVKLLCVFHFYEKLKKTKNHKPV